MLNSPMLSIFQHFHAIPLRSSLISLRSKWRLTGFSRRITPKNPVRLHNPFGELPRWGAKNVFPLNLTAFPSRGRCPAGADRVTMVRKTAGIRYSGTPRRAASPPRQIASKNEMIVISHHLLCREIGLGGEGGSLKTARGDPCFLHAGYPGEAPWKLRNLLSRQQKNALLLRAFFYTD